ncbi:Sec14p-like phosphatidylinositol transfer family protein [Perilla frutescens var. hirtella]|uniref:Sec14p-like phosphatidylinositol transfer family protein n=1 Tax=Perilla frutescens var. hirtella TaxID=608512 RepID=A0AAD4IR44_PERFH|nr:Sec14p-like phosphatidylinositol transfer family protein [Perilla frutescens var. hirtella]
MERKLKEIDEENREKYSDDNEKMKKVDDHLSFIVEKQDVYCKMERTLKEKEEDDEEEEEIFYSPERMEEKIQENEEIQSNDHDEKKKIDQLRERVAKQDPDSKEVDDLTLRRFLRARDLDIEKASAMFMKYSTWRRMFVPTGSIPASDVANQAAQNKMFMQGVDKRGCPVAVIHGAKHFPSKGSNDELKRFAVFVLDKICSRIPCGQEKFTIIVDLKGYGYSNSDVRGYIAALSILQDYYPERLKKLFFVHVPYIFMTAWKIIYPFVDKNTRKKITFVENKKLHDALLEEIDLNQLPEIYGGKLQLVPIQDA